MDNPVVLFDGVCNFCNNFVNFVLKNDEKELFRFAPLQSDAGRKLLLQYGLNPDELSSSVLIADGKTYFRSEAGLRILKLLGNGWQLFYPLIWVPKFISDGIFYRLIAKNRYRWFGRRSECMVPKAAWRTRFLT